MKSKPKQKLSRRAMILIACGLSIVIAPLASLALQRDPETQKRYDEIAAMTASQRTRLEYQYEEFRKLPESEKQRFRELHAQLNGEHNDLQSVMTTYNEFLRTLNPVDRADVESTRKVTDKLATVGKLVAERQNQQAQLQETFESFNRTRNNNDGLPPDVLVLDANDLAALGTILEAQLSGDVLRKLNLNQLDPHTRFAVLLEAVLKSRVGIVSSGENKLFSDQTIRELFTAIESLEKRETLSRRGETNSEKLAYLLRSANITCSRELMIQAAPTPQQLQEILNAMSPQLRKEYFDKSPRMMYFELVKQHFNAHPTPLSKSVYENFLMLEKLFPYSRWNRRPGDRPDGRPGDRPSDRPGDRPDLRPRPEDRERPGKPPGDPEARRPEFKDRLKDFVDDRRRELDQPKPESPPKD